METYSPSSQGVLSAGSSKLMRNHSTIALTAAECFIPRRSGRGDGGPMSKLSLVGAMIMLLKEKPPDVRPSGCWVINSKPDPVVELFFGRDRFHRPADLFG